MTIQLTRAFLLASIFLPLAASSHHSRAAFFDMSKTVELEGEITRVQWRHPHVRYWIRADDAYGGEIWEMETTPPSILERYGIGRDVLRAGTRVRVAGPPSKVAENVMEVSHVLLPSGQEVLLHTGLPPRWTENTIERELQPLNEAAVRAAEASASGIFRVWARQAAPTVQRLFVDNYPLTDAAQAAKDAWNPTTEIDTGCMPKGMPRTMANNWPMEFVDEGDRIRMRLEEFDIERVIHLEGGTPEPSPWGYSVGRWDDDDLVVETSMITLPDFDRGVPLTADAEITERFSMSEDERELGYELTVIDPSTFTEPVTLTSSWVWRPGEIVKPYNCIDTPGSWSNVDR